MIDCSTKEVSQKANSSEAEKSPPEIIKFTAGDRVRAIRGCKDDWPLKAGDTYEVAIVVIAGFSQQGPTHGVILDPVPTDKYVSSGGQYPYVWDSSLFVYSGRVYQDKKPVFRLKADSQESDEDTEILKIMGPCRDLQDHDITP